MNLCEFRHIQTHLRFLRRAVDGGPAHWLDQNKLIDMRSRLKSITLHEMNRHNISFHEVAKAIIEIDTFIFVISEP